MKAIEMITDELGVTVAKAGLFSLSASCIAWERVNLKPNTTYACVMIELPKGKRLVTEEEKDKYDKPGYYSYRMTSSGRWSIKTNNTIKTWADYIIYCVDKDYQFEKPLPVVKLTIGGKDVELSPESIKAIQELTK